MSADDKDSRRYVPGANPDKARADAERARSGAWGTHEDKRTKRRRTRADGERSAIRDDLESS